MTTTGQVGIRKQVAQRLKQAREAAGYKTAEMFCEEHDIPLQGYMQHEEAKSAIKASQAVTYSRYLDVSLFWLMLGGEEFD